MTLEKVYAVPLRTVRLLVLENHDIVLTIILACLGVLVSFFHLLVCRVTEQKKSSRRVRRGSSIWVWPVHAQSASRGMARISCMLRQ
jgi:hypothetical protein